MERGDIVPSGTRGEAAIISTTPKRVEQFSIRGDDPSCLRIHKFCTALCSQPGIGKSACYWSTGQTFTAIYGALLEDMFDPSGVGSCGNLPTGSAPGFRPDASPVAIQVQPLRGLCRRGGCTTSWGTGLWPVSSQNVQSPGVPSGFCNHIDHKTPQSRQMGSLQPSEFGSRKFVGRVNLQDVLKRGQSQLLVPEFFESKPG